VVSINVYVGDDDEKVDVPLTVSLPYELKPNENPAAVRVWRMDDRGNLTDLYGVFDRASGMITFTVNHQSYFVVGYDPVALWVNIFSDITEDDRYYSAVAFMNFHGYMVGYGNDTFGSGDTLTRAQFAMMLWRMDGEPTPEGTVSFSDAAPDAWFYDPVIWAAESGVVTGRGDGTFDPGTPISRQEAVMMLHNFAAVYKGIDIPQNRELPNFAENNEIDHWAAEEAATLAEAGVLRDDEQFRPRDQATRGEAAEMFRSFVRFVLS
jgi:hypothetical protein